MEHNSVQNRKPKTQSISRRFSYAFTGVVTLLLVGFAMAGVLINMQRIDTELDTRLDNAINLSLIALPTPLWNLDNDAVDDFVEALFLDEAVVYARVLWGTQVNAERRRPGFQQKDFSPSEQSAEFIGKTAQIVFEGTKVGTIQIVMSRESVRKQALVQISGIVALTVLIITAISLTSVAITRRYISRPLSTLQNSATLIASGDLEAPIDTGSEDEIGSLAQDLDAMRGSIKEARENLEHKVEKRTRELRRSVEELKALGEIGQTISSTLDLEKVLATIVARAVELSQTDAGTIYEFDETEQVFKPRANYGISDELVEALRGSRIGIGDGTVGQAAAQRAPFQIPDIENAPAAYSARDVHKRGGFRAVLGVPLLREERIIGGLVVRRKTPGEFPQDILDLLQTFATQSALAIQNARLFQEIQAKSGQLGEANSAMDAVLKTIEYGVLFLDSQLRIRLSNRAYREMWRVPGQFFESKPTFPELMEFHYRNGVYAVQEEEWEDYRKARIKAIKKGDLAPTELQLADGKVLQYQVLSLPDGGRMLTYFDITELKRREAELAEFVEKLEITSQHKSQFLANMSHELRTPLNAIIGFSEVLLEKMFGDVNERQEEYLNDIFTSGKHLLNLINDILDLSKIEAGKMELEPTAFNLRELLEGSLVVVKERALAHGITLSLDMADDIDTIIADERKVKQVVFNLLSNAVKFTPDKGKVGIRVRLSDDHVEIAVSDTGAGIAPEDQQRIFEEFQQAGETLTGKPEGTGLGLTVTKKFVELHGGRIWVESTPQQGSIFTFTLPIKADVAAVGHAEQAADEESAEQARPTGPLVLVIEDDPKAVDLLRIYLSEANYTVEIAKDGAEGLEKAKQLSPSAIILDVLLPKVDGWDFLGHVKADPTTKDIPVIIVSIVDQKGKGFALGAADYLVKPIKKETLLKALNTFKLELKAQAAPFKILAIDDDPKTVELLAATLEPEGFRVLKTYGGAEGVEVAKAEQPDVIILDLLMPEVNGFEVLDRLEQIPDTKKLPVIIFTVKHLTTKEKQRLKGRIARLAQKDAYNPQRLVGMVREVLQHA